MTKQAFDTSELIQNWHFCWARSRSEKTAQEVVKWSRQLIANYYTNAILTPVYLEFVAGATSKEHMRLAQAYLEPFQIVDRGRILPEDWREAIRLATRVPPDG